MAPTAEITTAKDATKTKVRGYFDISKANVAKAKVAPSQEYEYESLRPTFPDIKWEPLTEFEYKDKALGADPEYKSLFAACDEVIHVTPRIGTELVGLKLGELTDQQKDELALLTAYRGVVFLRGQRDFDIKQQLALGRYWGKLHKHATTAMPRDWEKEGLEEVHVVWGDETRLPPVGAYTSTYLWHSDVTYELQPPGYTMLKLLQGPEVGGDTLWSSGYAIYDLLSPGLQAYLESHTALHSAEEQANDSRRSGRTVRREPVVTEHPLVRVHPVTGYKSVFVNPGFTKAIVGVPKGESDAILNYLFELIATSVEVHARFKWQPGDLALWDNRVTNHTASYGFYPHRRHAVRVTVHGERPYFDKNGVSQREYLEKELGIKLVEGDGSRPGNYND